MALGGPRTDISDHTQRPTSRKIVYFRAQFIFDTTGIVSNVKRSRKCAATICDAPNMKCPQDDNARYIVYVLNSLKLLQEHSGHWFSLSEYRIGFVLEILVIYHMNILVWGIGQGEAQPSCVSHQIWEQEHILVLKPIGWSWNCILPSGDPKIATLTLP